MCIASGTSGKRSTLPSATRMLRSTKSRKTTIGHGTTSSTLQRRRPPRNTVHWRLPGVCAPIGAFGVTGSYPRTTKPYQCTESGQAVGFGGPTMIFQNVTFTVDISHIMTMVDQTVRHNFQGVVGAMYLLTLWTDPAIFELAYSDPARLLLETRLPGLGNRPPTCSDKW